jgi:dolichol-phosphate mannosyltransferase
MTAGSATPIPSQALAVGASRPAAGEGPHTLAVVVPVFNEHENLPELCRRVKSACESVAGLRWQMIMVDDGSRDDTAALALSQHEADARFHLIRLSRNFGHQAAITAGLAHADADAVIIMDADLQDPPELIPELVEAWRNGGQVVLAQRKSRAEKGLRRIGFDLFHRVFRWLSDFPIPSQTGVFGLLDRAAHQELAKLTERNRFIPGLRAWIGFDQRIVFYDRRDRAAGEPKQTIRRLMRYAMDGVFSFSYKPLRLMMWSGVFVSAVGFLLSLFFIIKRLTGAETAFTGFTTLITLVLFLGGMQLIAIGLLGEYLGRIYDEVKNRPMYIVKSWTGKRNDLSDEPRP